MAASPARQRAAQVGQPNPRQQRGPQIELLPENKSVRRKAPAKRKEAREKIEREKERRKGKK